MYIDFIAEPFMFVCMWIIVMVVVYRFALADVFAHNVILGIFMIYSGILLFSALNK